METVRLGRNITIEVEEGMEIILQDGVLKVISTQQEVSVQKEEVSVQWGDHTNPPIYPGWKKIEGATWDGKSGAYALDEHGFPMVWIPAAILPKGLIRVNYDNSTFSEEGYYEEVPEERIQQIIAEGGFYSPANPISRKDGKIQLCEGSLPLNNISYKKAVIELGELDTEGTGYRPIYGVEYDCICEWLDMNGYSMTDSTEWGNYKNTPNREYGLAPIGSRKKARTSIGINDFGGTLLWITEEKNGRLGCAVRGGSYSGDGGDHPAGERDYFFADDFGYAVGVWAVPFKK